MKLNDLVEAFASEIEVTQPMMEAHLEKLATLSYEDDDFIDALDAYSGQAQRMGEAAEMVGFPGLQAVCNLMVENTLLLIALEPHERTPILDFARSCPNLMVNYLKNLDDPSCAAGLMDILTTAPSPISTDEAIKIAYQLGSIPVQVTQAPSQDGRPVLVSNEMLGLTIPDNLDFSLMTGFSQEAPEQSKQLVQIAQFLSKNHDSADQNEQIETAKRIAHTLKGSGNIIGLPALANTCHQLEDILEYCEEHNHIPKNVVNLLLDTAFCLEQMVSFIIGEDEYPTQVGSILQNLLDTANRIDQGEDISIALSRYGVTGSTQTQTDNSDATEMSVLSSPQVQKLGGSASSQSSLRVDMSRIEELFRLSGEIMLQSNALETRLKTLMDGSKLQLQQNLRIQKRLYDLEGLIDTRSQALLQQDHKSNFDLLEMDEYNELHSAKNALLEEANDGRLYVNRINENIADIGALQIQQQRLIKDLQHLVLSTRMTSVNVLESRLQRNVRTTCQNTGKKATFQLLGGDTLIDSDVLNHLSEPLMHILRNAVDHGIETPEQRLLAEKDETGHISFSFAKQGQMVVLTCTDDGHGLDTDAILQKAISKGLVSEETPLSEKAIQRLILSAGFSTKTDVTQISGRGVGMDVVAQWIQGLNGSIDIHSRLGEGTTFEFRFPASLSSQQSLIISVNDQKYAVPYVSITQVVSRGVGEFKKMDNRWVYHYEDYHVPLLAMATLLGERLNPQKKHTEYDIIIVYIDNKNYALAVDELHDARDLLVKNPPRYASHVSGISGLSVLGDGSIAINLDIAMLIKNLSKPKVISRKTKQKAVVKKPLILVVDDALSVRNSLKEFLQDIGFAVKTAKDGMEAIEQLEAEKPLMVITDLEMPNLNGVELTSYIRHNDVLKTLPVIMITSRSQNKHRQMADTAGVNAYLTKPYNDTELAQYIQKCLDTSFTHTEKVAI